jgi:hypothetical protein
MSSCSPPRTNDIGPFRLAVLIDFVFRCETSCRLALRLSDPMKQDVYVKGASQQANHCQDDENMAHPTHGSAALFKLTGLEERDRSAQRQRQRQDSEAVFKKSSAIYKDSVNNSQ